MTTLNLLSPDLFTEEPKQTETDLGSKVPIFAIIGLLVTTWRSKSLGVTGVIATPFSS
ncbi:MAG: hypothetical protein ACBR50_10045 [Microcoleus sp.]